MFIPAPIRLRHIQLGIAAIAIASSGIIFDRLVRDQQNEIVGLAEPAEEAAAAERFHGRFATSRTTASEKRGRLRPQVQNAGLPRVVSRAGSPDILGTAVKIVSTSLLDAMAAGPHAAALDLAQIASALTSGQSHPSGSKNHVDRPLDGSVERRSATLLSSLAPDESDLKGSTNSLLRSGFDGLKSSYWEAGSHPTEMLLPKGERPQEMDEPSALQYVSGRAYSLDVRPGDSFITLLKDMGVEPTDLNRLAPSLVGSSASDLFPNQTIAVWWGESNDENRQDLERVSVFEGDYEVARFGLTSHGVFSEIATFEDKRSIPPRLVSVSEAISSILIAHGNPREAAARFLRAVWADADLGRFVRPADKVEMLFVDSEGDAIDSNLPVFASLEIDGTTREYYRFRAWDGSISYYDRKGRNARRVLMRKPVAYARLTSPFGSRQHPLMGYERLHSGIDWAAVRGTPILSAGNGVITKVERVPGYGNLIEISHESELTTRYAHLDRFADGIEPGMQVQQGEIMGYVGSTGISSGPHLHYEIRLAGEAADPTSVDIPHVSILDGLEGEEFRAVRENIDLLRSHDLLGAESRGDPTNHV